jgi:trigger factor
VTVSIPSESVDREIDKAYFDLRKNVKIKGFRPGKTPFPILKRYFQSQVEEDVISELVKETYPRALDEINVSPISQPKIENGMLEKGRDFSYTAVFEIKPDIDVRNYNGLELEKKKIVEITEEDVEKEIEILRNSFATIKSVEERAIKDRDYVVLDFNGTIDGKSYPGVTQNDFSLEIADDSFLPGFTEQLKGLNKGDKKTFALEIPENYYNQDIAGKTVTFAVMIKEIKEKVLPEVDNEFAKDIGNYADIDDLKLKLKESIAEKKVLDSEASLKEKIFDLLIENNPFDVPKAMVETQARNMVINTQQILSAQGLKLEDIGQSVGRLFDQYRQPAERQVRTALLLEAVANKEAIVAEDEDFEAKYKELADQIKQDVASVKAKVDRDMLRPQILDNKALNLIISNANIIEK